MNYRDEWMAACFGHKGPRKLVRVQWANGSRADYSADLVEDLKRDPACIEIMDVETGEVIYPEF